MKYFLKTHEALVVKSQETDTKEMVMAGITLFYYLYIYSIVYSKE